MNRWAELGRRAVREGRADEARVRALVGLTALEVAAGLTAVLAADLYPGWIAFALLAPLMAVSTGSFGTALLASMIPWTPTEDAPVVTHRPVQGGMAFILPTPGPVPVPVEVGLLIQQFIYSFAGFSVVLAVVGAVLGALAYGRGDSAIEIWLLMVAVPLHAAIYGGTALAARAVVQALSWLLQAALWKPSTRSVSVIDGTLRVGFRRFQLLRPHRREVTAHGGRVTLDLIGDDQRLALASTAGGIGSLVDMLDTISPRGEAAEIPEKLVDLVGNRVRRGDRQRKPED